jgi:uncharacterized protein (TIGR02646 family)
VIPVKEKAEPSTFAARVRQPGQAWLKANGIPFDGPKPKKLQLEPFWRECLAELHDAYGGICAYLCGYIELVEGAANVDHFVAASQKPVLAYEWSNFRLACLGKNRKKSVQKVLDPFKLRSDTFRLELTTGRIYPNDALSTADKTLALKTIENLGLDDPGTRAYRARRFSEYLKIRGAERNAELESWLERYYPFICYEARRQGLL